MTVYKIVDWGKYYENYRTRELKRMTWVPMPNKFDGDGYTKLLEHVNGSAHFGAWCALVELASRCKVDTTSVGGRCKVGTIPQESARKYRDSGKYDASDYPYGRGILMRESGEPHDAKSLERITRIPVSVWEEALPRLVTIGWVSISEMSVVRRYPVGSASVPSTDALPTKYPMNGTEKKERKTNRRTRVRLQNIGSASVSSAPKTSEPEEEKDDDPFDEKQVLEAAAPADPPVLVPADEEVLKARVAEGEKSGDVAMVLMAGLELMNGHPFPSYPKEWKAAHQVEEKIRRVGKGEHPLGFLRGLLQAYLAKRENSKQEYWRDAPLSPSAINVRFDQILGSVQKLASDALGAQIVSDFLKERQR